MQRLHSSLLVVLVALAQAFVVLAMPHGIDPLIAAGPAHSTTAAASSATPTTPKPNYPACPPRPAVGGAVLAPPTVRSINGVLDVTLNYRQATVQGEPFTRYCYEYNGFNAPTLRLYPGDRLRLKLVNQLPPPPSGSPRHVYPPEEVCGSNVMDLSSTNVHFHGSHVSPACTKDHAVFTLVNAGQTFPYDIQYPTDQSPGLLWYHPHVHGLAERALQGGASGAVIIEGMEKAYPAVADLPELLVIIRDQLTEYHIDELPHSAGAAASVPTSPQSSTTLKTTTKATTTTTTTTTKPAPAWDVTVNYVPVLYPDYIPAVLALPANHGQSVFWRLLNAAAGSSLNLQLQYDGVPQLLQIVARDGVPLDPKSPVFMTTLPFPPAARFEFIAPAPSKLVKVAMLVALENDTGPDGDANPPRPLAKVVVPAGLSSTTAKPTTKSSKAIESHTQTYTQEEIAALVARRPVVTRKLFFSEEAKDPEHPDSGTVFFITVDGEEPKAYDPLAPPDIIATRGTVEDWVIENRALEEHVFHIHQLHFLVLEENGKPVAANRRVLLDNARIGHWDGKGGYPSVKIRMDFSGDIVGADFVYHCHILEHEDEGMMAAIRVVEPTTTAKTTTKATTKTTTKAIPTTTRKPTTTTKATTTKAQSPTTTTTKTTTKAPSTSAATTKK